MTVRDKIHEISYTSRSSLEGYEELEYCVFKDLVKKVRRIQNDFLIERIKVGTVLRELLQ